MTGIWKRKSLVTAGKNWTMMVIVVSAVGRVVPWLLPSPCHFPSSSLTRVASVRLGSLFIPLVTSAHDSLSSPFNPLREAFGRRERRERETRVDEESDSKVKVETGQVVVTSLVSKPHHHHPSLRAAGRSEGVTKERRNATRSPAARKGW